MVPFFNFGPEVRRLIYTTNCIEALNRSIRKVIKTRSLFPNEDAAKKLIWLAIKNSAKEWNKIVFKWRQALLEMQLFFGERLRLDKAVAHWAFSFLLRSHFKAQFAAKGLNPYLKGFKLKDLQTQIS